MKFELLVDTITQTHSHFQQLASKAVNVSLTCRNWLIGYYIVEFEQKGEDRAKYGTRLVDSLAEKLNKKGLGNRNLKLFKQFYLAYTELHEAVLHYVDTPDNLISGIVQLPTAQLSLLTNLDLRIVQTPSAQLGERNKSYFLHIVQHISFSHFAELIKIEDKTK